MDWVRAGAGILITVVLALLLGWTQTSVKRRGVKALIWVGAILLLLVVRFFDGQPFIFLVIFLAATWDALRNILNHIPHWLIYVAAACIVGKLFLNLISRSFVELAQEIERTNARIELLENSVRAKFDDISSRLPPRDEPEYLKELRKEAHRD